MTAFGRIRNLFNRDSYTKDIHTAQDVVMAREVLMMWAEHTGNADAAARQAEKITKRAVDLGLETP